MNKVCVYSVIFPSNLKYFREYLSSLQNQSFCHFDIILLNDNVRESELTAILNNYSSLKFIIVPVSGSLEEIRHKGFDFIRNSSYEQIIFCDTDDYFAPNRISDNLDLLKIADIVVNDVTLVSETKKVISEKYFSARLNDGDRISIDFIKDKNILGFSNTSIKKSIVNNVMLSTGVTAIDWYFFSSLALNSESKIVFANSTITYYRQHTSNIAGLSEVTQEKILKAVEVKLKHYEALKRYSAYAKLYIDFVNLYNRLKDAHFCIDYINYIKSINLQTPFWWEEALDYKNENTINR